MRLELESRGGVGVVPVDAVFVVVFDDYDG